MNRDVQTFCNLCLPTFFSRRQASFKPTSTHRQQSNRVLENSRKVLPNDCYNCGTAMYIDSLLVFAIISKLKDKAIILAYLENKVIYYYLLMLNRPNAQ